MEENNEIIVGLDIGTTKVSVIVAKKTASGKFEILGTGKSKSYGVRKGQVTNIHKTVEAIQEAVNEAQNESSYEITEVYAGIAGSHIKSMHHRGSIIRDNSNEEITKKEVKIILRDMHKLAMEPGMQIVHVPPQEYYIDNQAVGNDPVGMCGSRLEADFHIITGRTAAAQNIERSVEKAGLKMAGLILEPLASSESALDPLEKEAGVVLVDIGGGTTDIAIFYKNIIRHTCVIPFGGNIITSDIEEGCTILKKQAELLKVKFGSALALDISENKIVSIAGIKGRRPKEISVKNLANIIQSRVDEIFEHVYYEIKASGFSKKMGAGIVLTGGGSQLKNIKQLAEYVTGLDTRLGQPLENLMPGYDKKLKSPIYATGLGLLKRAEFEEKYIGKLTQQEEITEKISSEEKDLITNIEHRPVSSSWWKKIAKSIPNWLMDDQDDSDYE